MMKKIILLIGILIATASCENDFSDWNVDGKKHSKVPASTLFSNAQRNMVRTMKMQSVNINVFNLFAQYWSSTTYPDESNYNLGVRDTPGGFWNRMYRDVLIDLKESQKLLLEQRKEITSDKKSKLDENTNKQAVNKILTVYAYHVLVDVFGDVPYTKALSISNPSPKYDDDAKIYEDLFVKLDEAIGILNTSAGSYGSADFIYKGDVSKWKKFANSLKLRMAMRVKDGNKIKEAISGGIFTSNADNAAFVFTVSHPYSNPLWENLVHSGRNDLLVSDTFVNIISPLNDPRAGVYMADNKTPYIGAPYGANNSYKKYTHLGSIFHKPDFEGVILDYAEVEFLLAEAAARGLGGVSDAEGHYKKAIKASITYWNADADADTYIAQPSVAYDSNNWKKSIGVQKWIALYSRGFEGWSSWRIFGYPILEAPSTAHADAEGKVPVRYVYPADESQRNGINYEAASAAIGGDKMTTKVFWDKN